MRNLLAGFMILAAISGAAEAQSTNAAPMTGAPAAAAAKPQTVKKVVCHRVDDEETTGSRVGSAPKVCKTIEVPAGGSGNGSGAPRPNTPERGA